MDIKYLIGPAATKSEFKVLDKKPGNELVSSLKEKLEQKISTRQSKDDLGTRNLQQLINDEKVAFDAIHQRGLKLDVPLFKERINEVITQYRERNDQKQQHVQENIRDAVLLYHNKDNVMHPILSTTNSRTGRITVSKPALQNWKSKVRHALLPNADGFEEICSIDCKAYDPTVLALLSNDEQMLSDLKNDDFYIHLMQWLNVGDITKENRKKFKKVFLACFINGGDINYHLNSIETSLTMSQWQLIEERYFSAVDYRNSIQNNKKAASLNGLTYHFKSNDNAAFSKFLQHEAAYIFRQMFIAVFKMEEKIGVKVLLPLHDEIIFASANTDAIDEVRTIMINTFKEITGSDSLRTEYLKRGRC